MAININTFDQLMDHIRKEIKEKGRALSPEELYAIAISFDDYAEISDDGVMAYSESVGEALLITPDGQVRRNKALTRNV